MNFKESIQKLNDLIESKAKSLKNTDFNFDKVAFLKALAMCESSFSRNNVPRFEPLYFKDGFYYRKSPLVRDLVEKFDRDAACSYSSFQILFVTAFEFGFKGNPSELKDDSIALPIVITFINKRIIRFKPNRIEDMFDAYNSGNFKDNIIPEAYINKAMTWYNYYLNKG